MAEERTCIICGTHYKWCNTCHDYDPTETWKYLYHDASCMNVSIIWRAYRGNEISKAEAKRQMDRYPDVIAMALENTSIPAKEIQEIYKTKVSKPVEQQPVDQPIDEQNIAQSADVETKPVTEKPKRRSSNRNVKNN